MKVLSVREYKKGGGRLTLELDPPEYDVFFIAGLKKMAKDAGAKVTVMTIPEAKRRGVKAKKTVEFSKKDCDACVAVAVIDALTLAAKRKWKPGKK